MSEQKINPKVRLEAANIAYPNLDFAISGNDVRQRIPHSPYFGRCFNPLTSDDDAMKLERALKKERWVFWQVAGMYCGQRRNSDYMKPAQPVYQDECDTLLLLKCVSAMTGLPLHAKGVEG